jgi:hypothetical protein
MSSTTIIIIEKNGNIKEQNVKSLSESELYKKASLKSAEGFKCYAQWEIEDLHDNSYSLSVYGKTTGRAGQENKYEFPPPIDSVLFFGGCVIVNKQNGQFANLKKADWEAVYEHLYGGFDDVCDNDDEDEEEDDDDEDDGIPKTATGYAKDGFVVDDEDPEEDNDDEEEDEEEDLVESADEEEVYVKKRKSVAKPKKKPVKTAKAGSSKKDVIEAPLTNTLVSNTDIYMDCTSELSEESYT